MSSKANRRVRISGQAGFGLVEVLVTALVVLLVATATVSSIDTSQKTSARTLARGITANLAERDQERMRSLRATDLANYAATQTVTQESVNYTVNSNTEFVAGAGDETVSCTSTGEQSRYLRLTSTVTPQASLRADPLTIKSLYALPIAQYSPTSGTLIVQIYKADGVTGQPNIGVKVTGPDTRTVDTNDKGCAVFQFLAPGAYNIVVDETGFVNPSLEQRVTYSGTVAAGQINQATPLLYDRAGQIVVDFDGRTTTKATGFTISNSSIVGPTTRTFAPRTAGGLFPFTEAYQAYSGTCQATTDSTNATVLSANDPTRWEPNFYTKYPGYGSSVVPPGGTVAVKVHEPRIDTKVEVTYSNGSKGTPADLQTYLLQSDSGCGSPGPVYTTKTKSDGKLQDEYYPYGNYYVCAEYRSGTTTWYGLSVVPNTAFGGTPPNQLVSIDTRNSNYKRSCLSLM